MNVLHLSPNRFNLLTAAARRPSLDVTPSKTGSCYARTTHSIYSVHHPGEMTASKAEMANLTSRLMGEQFGPMMAEYGGQAGSFADLRVYVVVPAKEAKAKGSPPIEYLEPKNIADAAEKKR